MNECTEERRLQLRTLGYGHSLEIVNYLYNHPPDTCTNSDIQAALQIAQSDVSYYLSHLRRAGLVTTRRAGLWAYHTLTLPEELEEYLLLSEVQG